MLIHCNEYPSKRSSASEILKIINSWIFLPFGTEIENISKELKSNIMEFINAPIEHHTKPITKSHSQAYYTSHLFDFTSKKLNEILESECLNCIFNNEKLNENPESECLNCMINDNMKPLGMYQNGQLLYIHTTNLYIFSYLLDIEVNEN